MIVASDSAPRMPYPGLRSFRRDESDLFFGRDDCIGMMVDRLGSTHLLSVIGSSGTGKSSLVRTGLLDALDLGLMAGVSSDWCVVEFSPGASPTLNLARGLVECEQAGAASDTEAELMRAFLLRGPRAITEWAAEGHLPSTRNLLLLVDQFEELFRFQDYAGREEAAAFVALLIESTRQAASRIYVVLTMRSEYMGACSLIDGLAEAINTGLYLIPRMNRGQCRDAIVGPATNCGFEIDKALLNRLLNDLAAFAPWDDQDEGRGRLARLERLGRRADQLPLLQYCLNRMWARARDASAGAHVRLTLADYEQIGALHGALDSHADEILADLGHERLRITEKVFRTLTEGVTTAAAVRRPTEFGKLVGICDGDEVGVKKVIDAFCDPDCNFLILKPGTASSSPVTRPEDIRSSPHATATKVAHNTIIDVTHECLIRQWQTLSRWLSSEGLAAEHWRRLSEYSRRNYNLPTRELNDFLAWRDLVKPNPAWSSLYGGHFEQTMRYLQRSENYQRRKRNLNVFAVLIFISILLLALIYLVREERIKEANAKQLADAIEHVANVMVNTTIKDDSPAAYSQIDELNDLIKPIEEARKQYPFSIGLTSSEAELFNKLSESFRFLARLSLNRDNRSEYIFRIRTAIDNEAQGVDLYHQYGLALDKVRFLPKLAAGYFNIGELYADEFKNNKSADSYRLASEFFGKAITANADAIRGEVSSGNKIYRIYRYHENELKIYLSLSQLSSEIKPEAANAALESALIEAEACAQLFNKHKTDKKKMLLGDVDSLRGDIDVLRGDIGKFGDAASRHKLEELDALTSNF